MKSRTLNQSTNILVVCEFFVFLDLTCSPFNIVKQLLLFRLSLYLWTHICRCFSTGVTLERPINMTEVFKYHKPVRIAKMSEVSYRCCWCESICIHCRWVRRLAYRASQLLWGRNSFGFSTFLPVRFDLSALADFSLSWPDTLRLLSLNVAKSHPWHGVFGAADSLALALTTVLFWVFFFLKKC